MTVKRVSVAAALAAATLLSGCGSTAPTSSREHVAFRLDETRFVKPLDAFEVTTDGQYGYALRLSIARCMADRGYHLDVADPADYQGAALTISVALSVARAERWGYHIGPVRGGVADTLLDHLPARENAALATCAKRAESHLGLDNGVESAVQMIGWKADTAVQVDPKVVAAGARWRSCMQPLGIPDLPTEPVLGAMPSASQHRRFWKATAEDSPSSPDEVREAVFDARCRHQTGWNNTYYRGVVDHQVSLMQQHPDLLAAARSQKQRVDARVAAVVRELGGAAR